MNIVAQNVPIAARQALVWDRVKLWLRIADYGKLAGVFRQDIDHWEEGSRPA